VPRLKNVLITCANFKISQSIPDFSLYSSSPIYRNVYKLQPRNHGIYSLKFSYWLNYSNCFGVAGVYISQLTTDSSDILRNMLHANEAGVELTATGKRSINTEVAFFFSWTIWFINITFCFTIKISIKNITYFVTESRFRFF